MDRIADGLRILLVTESYWPNLDGGAFFERRLAHGLAGRGHQVAVWAPSRDGRQTIEVDGRTRIFRARSRILLSNTRYRVALLPLAAAKIFGVTTPDIVHIHNPGPLGRHALAEARRQGIPVVATNHLLPDNLVLNTSLRLLPGDLGRAAVWRYLIGFLNRFDLVVSPSAYGLGVLLEHGLRAAGTVVTNGVDLEAFAARPRSGGSTALRALTLGRLDHEKDVATLIRAFGSFAGPGDVSLTIAGTGKLDRELRQLAADMPHPSRLRFLGPVSEEEKVRLLASHDLFCVSGSAELQCIAALEAMASGLPVLAARGGALPELVRAGVTGLLFEPGDVGSCQQSISVACARGTDDLARQGAAARRLIAAHHGADRALRDYESAMLRLARPSVDTAMSRARRPDDRVRSSVARVHLETIGLCAPGMSCCENRPSGKLRHGPVGRAPHRARRVGIRLSRRWA